MSCIHISVKSRFLFEATQLGVELVLKVVCGDDSQLSISYKNRILMRENTLKLSRLTIRQQRIGNR